MSTQLCTIRLWAGRGCTAPCGRSLTDPCGHCRAFDEHKDEWEAIFNEYRDKPRTAVEGDI